ncbi:hypothetical protein [uncultured Algoriphagus sp.]|uniref:TlpA family protein disulfide reductase n=1 Tax=uncultured Algoriphagus sp. TaxID=417365 RepID=UPI0030EEA7F3|tara:strand:+ start:43287 stop:44945 length:1659 start_codon:yes stop_codon:yes gene_type:complete
MKKTLLICLLGYLCLPTSTTTAQVADSPPETDLVDYSGIPGQEGASSSACLEGMLYLEIPAASGIDTLVLTYWEKMLSSSPAISPGHTIPLVGHKGTFFEGSGNMTVFTCYLPEEVDQGYFSLSAGKVDLIRNWNFKGLDRVRIRFDQSSGMLLFGGPQADFYRTQYYLDQAVAESKFNSDPLLLAGTSEGLFENSSSGERYRRALQKPDDLYVKLKVLVPAETGWEYLKEYLSIPVTQNPAWKVVQRFKDVLTATEYQLLEARVVGTMLKQGVNRAEFALDHLKESPAKQAELLGWAADLHMESLGASHPLLIEGAVGLALVEAKMKKEDFFGVVDTYPARLKDPMIGNYVLGNYNKFGDNLSTTLDRSIAFVETSWIKEQLISLKEVQLGGFLSGGLYDEQGKSVDLIDYSGKTLLIHYWISGCKFCVDDYQTVLTPLKGLLAEESGFSEASDIILVTINADSGEDSWRNSLRTGKYTSDQFLNLKAVADSEVLSRYGIEAFPQKMIVGPDSKVRFQSLHRLAPRQLHEMLDSIQAGYANQSITLHHTQP